MKKKISLSSILGVLIIFQFLSIVYFNYTKAYGILNLDSSLALRHACEMWKNGIFLQNFNFYSSSLEIDCIGFFVAGLYNLTGNLNLSMALCHGIGYLLTALLFLDVNKQLNNTKEQFFIMLLLYFTPFSVDMLDWSQMLSFSAAQYSFRVFCLLLILDAMLILNNPISSKRKTFIIIIFAAVVNFWTSLSSGNYVLCMIILPIILAYLFISFKNHIPVLKDYKFYFIVFMVLISYVGFVLRTNYAGEGHRSSLNLVTTYFFIENLGNAITGLLQLLGCLVTKNSVSIFSEIGIATLLRFAFWVFSFTILIYRIWKDKFQSEWLTYIVMTILVNVGILMVTNTQYGSDIFEHRYHILWCVMALIGISSTLMERSFWGQDKKATNTIITILVLVIAAMNILGFRMLDNIDSQNGNKGFERTMIEVTKKQNTNAVLVQNWSGSPSVITLINPEMYSAYITSSDGQIIITSHNNYLSYTDNTKMSAHVLIGTEDFINFMPDHISSHYTLVDSETFGGGINAYYSSENMFDGISGLPLAADNLSIDLPYSPGYRSVGKLDETGRLIADTEESGFVLYGPNTPAVEGIYNITLEYEVIKPGEKNSFFDISTGAGQQIILRSDLSNDATSFTFENVEITGSAPLEFRVWKPGDATIAIKRIIFEQIN